MNMIKVYFNNGNTAIFNRDTLSFRDNDGSHFILGEDNDNEDNPRKQYATLLDAGPLVNWSSVAWVRKYTEEEKANDGI